MQVEVASLYAIRSVDEYGRKRKENVVLRCQLQGRVDSIGGVGAAFVNR